LALNKTIPYFNYRGSEADYRIRWFLDI